MKLHHKKGIPINLSEDESKSCTLCHIIDSPMWSTEKDGSNVVILTEKQIFEMLDNDFNLGCDYI